MKAHSIEEDVAVTIPCALGTKERKAELWAYIRKETARQGKIPITIKKVGLTNSDFMNDNFTAVIKTRAWVATLEISNN